VSVLTYITSGLQFANFKKKYPYIVPFYTEDEIDDVDGKFPKQISTGVGLILVGLICVILSAELSENILLMVTAGFLELIAISMFFFIPAGMNKARIDIQEYNKESNDDPHIKEIERKHGTWSGVIFMSATIIFLITGLVFNLWYINWIVYIVAALLSGITNIIIEGTTKRKDSE
jgi:uncharacterized membrane protein